MREGGHEGGTDAARTQLSRAQATKRSIVALPAASRMLMVSTRLPPTHQVHAWPFIVIPAVHVSRRFTSNTMRFSTWVQHGLRRTRSYFMRPCRCY